LAPARQRVAALPPRGQYLPLQRRAPAAARAGRNAVAPDRNRLRRQRFFHGPASAGSEPIVATGGAADPRPHRPRRAQTGRAQMIAALFIQVTLIASGALLAAATLPPLRRNPAARHALLASAVVVMAAA